jgi:hypothetical protein
MGEITAMVIVATVAFAIYSLFELFIRRKERMAVIEKISTGIDPNVLKDQFNLFSKKWDNNHTGSWAIRIGSLFVGVGLGITIAAIINLCIWHTWGVYHAPYEYSETMQVLYPACASIFGGLGLIIAYFIDRKECRKTKII